MTDSFKSTVKEIDKDLSHSWIDLSDQVRTMVKNLKLKTAGTEFAQDSIELVLKAEQLCDHVEKIHADVIDLIENIEDRVPLPEAEGSETKASGGLDCDSVEKEKIQVQRESHELRNDFKDILKALFMWVDDPEQRVREKQ